MFSAIFRETNLHLPFCYCCIFCTANGFPVSYDQLFLIIAYVALATFVIVLFDPVFCAENILCILTVSGLMEQIHPDRSHSSFHIVYSPTIPVCQ